MAGLFQVLFFSSPIINVHNVRVCVLILTPCPPSPPHRFLQQGECVVVCALCIVCLSPPQILTPQAARSSLPLSLSAPLYTFIPYLSSTFLKMLENSPAAHQASKLPHLPPLLVSAPLYSFIPCLSLTYVCGNVGKLS